MDTNGGSGTDAQDAFRVVDDRERRATLRLALAAGLGPVGIGRLLDRCGSAVAALDADLDAWIEALAARPERAAALRRRVDGVDLDGELAAIALVGARLLVVQEQAYPALLRAIPDPPPVLWVRGTLEAVDDWSVAIVGSRRSSLYGLEQAGRFASGLVEHGHTIVSGGARGIDAAAHRAALRANGRTIAVLGTGLARPYPPEHADLFEEIIAGGGAVLSEQPTRTDARPEFFPRRNRIISGLSLGVVLIEARARSGASITARLAVEDHGRDAMAVPGRVDQPTSEGTHRAIREGWAALVASPDDVVAQLSASRHLVHGALAVAPARIPARRSGRAEVSEPAVDLDALGPMARSIAARIVDSGERSGCSVEAAIADEDVPRAMAELTTLELLGLVRRDALGALFASGALLRALDRPRLDRPQNEGRRS
jgi:DNA processing protein